MVERTRVQDLNAQQQGNAPSARVAVGGIQNINKPNLDSGYRAGSGMDAALSALGATSAAFQQRNSDEDFINGQLDYMAGKTEEEVVAEGNKTTTAGFLSLGVSNAVSEWQTAQAEAINTESFSMDPEEYRAKLSAETATMLEKVGDDPYARATFAKSMSVSQGKLASAQAKANADYREQKTIGNYTEALLKHNKPLVSQSVEQANDHTSMDHVKEKDWVGYASTLQARNAQIESSGDNTAKATRSSATGLHQFTDGRWIESVKQHRPDLAKGASNAEILAMRGNAGLQKQLFVSETAEGAAELDAAGLPVNPTTSYLQWFLGNGGVKRFLRADPNASITTAVSGKSLASNPEVFRHDKGRGGYKTVAQVMDWANKKHGVQNSPVVQKATEQPTNGAPVDISAYKAGTANVEGLTPATKSRFSAMINSAPDNIKNGLKIYSGHRTPEHQARIIADNMSKYGLGSKVKQWQSDVKSMGAEAAGKKWRPLMRSKGLTKWVAMPGGSRHQKGIAMDLSYNGVRLGKPGTEEAVAWVKANANKFGMHVPMSWEPWQLELDPNSKDVVASQGTIGMNVGAQILANPGLSPAKHRTAVTNAIVMSLNNDEGGLYANAGGEAALVQIGATPQQIESVRTAKRAFDTRKENEYDASYESARNDLLDYAKSTDATEDGLRERLMEFNETHHKGDKAARALHRLAEETLDRTGDEAAKNAMQRIPSLMETVNEYKQDVLNGDLTPEDANSSLQAMAEQEGVAPESLAKAVKTMIDAGNTREESLRTAADKQFKAAEVERKKTQEVERLIATTALKTGTAAQQKKGIEIYRERAAKQIQEEKPQGEHGEALAHAMAEFLVKQDIVDTGTASRMRAGLRNPITKDDEVSDEAKSAFDFYMRMVGTAKASDEYMARMFKDDTETLDFLRDAEQIHAGDGDLESAVMIAQEARDNPNIEHVWRENVKRVNDGEMMNTIKDDLIEGTGRTDTFFNNLMNVFNTSFDEEFITDEQKSFLMEDIGLTRAIDSEIRTQTAITPHASKDSIRRRVMTQLSSGRFIGGSFIPGPAKGGASLHEMMGLGKHVEDGVENKAVMQYLIEHGEREFGARVWEDIGPSMPFEIQGGTRFQLGTERPEISVKLIGKHFEITPRSSKYAIEDPTLGGIVSAGANLSNPEAQVIRIPVRDIGDWYKDSVTRQDENSLLNMFIDVAQPAAEALGTAFSGGGIVSD